jgi:hypothetical protein
MDLQDRRTNPLPLLFLLHEIVFQVYHLHYHLSLLPLLMALQPLNLVLFMLELRPLLLYTNKQLLLQHQQRSPLTLQLTTGGFLLLALSFDLVPSTQHSVQPSFFQKQNNQHSQTLQSNQFSPPEVNTQHCTFSGLCAETESVLKEHKILWCRTGR